jgi:hypothetical protein
MGHDRVPSLAALGVDAVGTEENFQPQLVRGHRPKHSILLHAQQTFVLLRMVVVLVLLGRVVYGWFTTGGS